MSLFLSCDVDAAQVVSRVTAGRNACRMRSQTGPFSFQFLTSCC